MSNADGIHMRVFASPVFRRGHRKDGQINIFAMNSL
jgi:hypothetical protein